MSALIPYSNNIYINTNTGELLDTSNTLGTSAKSVDIASSPAERRALRYSLQAQARKLLGDQRVAQCMHRCGNGGVAVNVSQSTGIASFGGVVTCGSVWHCPVCSAKISNERRKELNTVLEWARKWSYQPVLLTLTARHGIEDSLSYMLDGMKAAKKRFHQSRGWRFLEKFIVGHITATEVTHGENGWHVHYHMLVVVDALGDAVDLFDSLADVWLKALRGPKPKKLQPCEVAPPPPIRLDGNGHAFGVQGAAQAGDYVSKWGAGEEVGLSGQKQGRKESRTPWELLADSVTSDHAAALFREYAQVFKGRRQLVWSRDFKRVLNIIEKSDEELSEAPEADDLVEVARIPKGVWRLVVRRNLQAELLEVAEEGGALYVDVWLQALLLQTERGVTSGS